jgi:hypothetical protein
LRPRLNGSRPEDSFSIRLSRQEVADSRIAEEGLRGWRRFDWPIF